MESHVHQSVGGIVAERSIEVHKFSSQDEFLNGLVEQLFTSAKSLLEVHAISSQDHTLHQCWMLPCVSSQDQNLY